MLSFVGAEGGGATDAAGMGSLPLATRPAVALVATAGKDSALVPRSLYPWGGHGWTNRVTGHALRYAVVDDRGMYKPGETASLKGFVRWVGEGPTGDVRWEPGKVKAVGWVARDARNNEIGKGVAPVGPLGGFDFEVKIPEGANLGSAQVRLEVPGEASGQHSFEYPGVPTARVRGDGVRGLRSPFRGWGGSGDGSGGLLRGRASGRLGGEVGRRGDSDELCAAEPARLFVWAAGAPSGCGTRRGRSGGRVVSPRGPTPSGVHRLRVDFDGVSPIGPTSVVAEAHVEDVNRQEITASATLLVHPLEPLRRTAARPAGS